MTNEERHFILLYLVLQEKLNYINEKKNLKELEFRNKFHIEYNGLQLFNYLFVHTFIKSTIRTQCCYTLN